MGSIPITVYSPFVLCRIFNILKRLYRTSTLVR
nr:MAG TPA: hypothetical protein [Caudoviricetes sp.]